MFPVLGKVSTDGWMAISQPIWQGDSSTGSKVEEKTYRLLFNSGFLPGLLLILTWSMDPSLLLGLNHSMLFPFEPANLPHPQGCPVHLHHWMLILTRKKTELILWAKHTICFSPSPNMQTVYLENQMAQLCYILFLIDMFAHIPATALWGSYEMISSIFPDHI